MKSNICIILSTPFAIFLIIYLCTQLSTWPDGNAPVLPGPPKQDYSMIKKRMQYHGTLVAWHDLKGQWYFYRKGERCQLK